MANGLSSRTGASALSFAGVVNSSFKGNVSHQGEMEYLVLGKALLKDPAIRSLVLNSKQM